MVLSKQHTRQGVAPTPARKTPARAAASTAKKAASSAVKRSTLRAPDAVPDSSDEKLPQRVVVAARDDNAEPAGASPARTAAGSPSSKRVGTGDASDIKYLTRALLPTGATLVLLAGWFVLLVACLWLFLAALPQPVLVSFIRLTNFPLQLARAKLSIA